MYARRLPVQGLWWVTHIPHVYCSKLSAVLHVYSWLRIAFDGLWCNIPKELKSQIKIPTVFKTPGMSDVQNMPNMRNLLLCLSL